MNRLLRLLLAALLGVLPVQAQQEVPLECSLNAGEWRQCTMRVERIGEHWWIRTADARIEFRHDGRGGVAMRREPGQRWRRVAATWAADASLCWDGVCARGAIPLD